MKLLGRNRPLAALRALVALAKDPDDLPRIVDVIGSLPGRSYERNFARMRASSDGRRILAERSRMGPRLANRASLLALPPGTLGHAYAEMTERAGISAEGMTEAYASSGDGKFSGPEEISFFDERLRDTHDLWHVVTGYGVDVLGELGLLAFMFAQTRHPGVLLIMSLAYVKSVPGAGPLMWQGYRRGAKAAWLPAVVWEDLLDRPLDDVRAILRVGPPAVYTPVTSDALRAAGRIPMKVAS